MNTEQLKCEIDKIIPYKQSEFDLFASHLVETKLSKGEVWEAEGKISQNMRFVNGGMLRQYYIKDGNEFTDNFFLGSDFIGNYISYLSQKPSLTYTVALESCELLTISFEQMERLYQVIPNVEKFSKLIGEKKTV